MTLAREFKLFLCAVQFLTRIPVPAISDFQPDWITRSCRYFPLVGQLVGTIAALTFWLALHLWSETTAALLAMAAGILVTGALHEDGLADAADGLAGGATAARRLAIMKDSHVGTYGVLAVGLCLALKVAILDSLKPTSAILLLIAAHGGGRAATVAAMALMSYVGRPEASKVSLAPYAVRPVELGVALAIGLWPFVSMPPEQALLALAAGAGLAIALCLAAKRLLGGYTGDILGAAEQLFEVGALLGGAIVGVTA